MNLTDDSRVLGLIPARSGSKGLPGKNIKDLGGKPLLAWSVEQALQSEHIDRTVLSTDSEEFAAVGGQYGADVPFERPAALARDESPSSEVVIHALDWFTERDVTFDIVVLLEPTSPLRQPEDIDTAIETYLETDLDADALVSVGEVDPEHPYYVKDIKDGQIVPYFETDEEYYQRQQLPDAYFPYGVVYLSSVESYRRERTFYQDTVVPHKIERWQTYEIDDIYDFLCVERILEYKREDVGGDA